MSTMRTRAPLAYSSTLSSGINDTQTTLSVASATGLPTKGFFYLAIGTEIVLVTKVSGTTLTIVRGQEGTTADSHNSGAAVKTIITKGTIEGYRREAGAIKCLPYGRIQKLAADGTLTTLTASNFSLVNAGTSQIFDGNDGTINFRCRDHGGNDTSGIVRAFGTSTDWRITAHIDCPAFQRTSPDILSFYARQNSGGTIDGLSLYPQDSVRCEQRNTFLTSPSTDISHGVQGLNDIWVRVEIEWNVVASTDNMRFYYSIDGVHWWLMFTYSFAMVTTSVGLFMTNITGTIAFMRSNILSWLEEEVTF